MKKKRYFIYGLLIAFLVLTILVITNSISSIDESIYEFLFSFRSSRMDALLKEITRFANTSTIIIVSFLFILLLERKGQYMLLTTLLSTVGMNQVLKFFIQRARPEHLRLIVENGYSFPSGHAMISIALYGFMIYYIYQKESNRIFKTFCIIFLLLLILAIGCSRIYLGVHYPSDVFGGYLLALVILTIVIEYFHKHYRGKLK